MQTSSFVYQRFLNLQNHPAWETFLWQEIADRLLENLEIMRVQPKRVINLGWEKTYSTALLEKRYPEAKISFLTTLIDEPDQSADFIFSNLYLPWCEDLEALLKNIARVLTPEGLFVFSSFGSSTHLFSTIAFPDFHDLGDLLLQHGLRDPVMESEMLSLEYDALPKLTQDFEHLALDLFGELPEAISLPVTLRFEIVSGHAWRASPAKNEFAVRFIKKTET